MTVEELCGTADTGVPWQDAIADVFMVVGAVTCVILAGLLVIGVVMAVQVERYCRRELELEELRKRIKVYEEGIWGEEVP